MNSNRLPRLTYYDPATIDDARALKEKFGIEAVFLSGGTDVLPMLKRRNIAARHVVSIKKIPDLGKITMGDDGRLTIGAAVTLREVIDSPLVADHCPLLIKAASSVAFNQVRNMATLVGNICVDNKCTYYNQSSFWWQSRPDCFKRGGDRCYMVKGGKQCYAVSAGDTVAALIALDAEVIISASTGPRHTAIEKFYSGDGHKPCKLGDDELVTALLLPPADNSWRQGYLKKSIRGAVDFAIATLAIRIRKNGPGVEDIRIALNGVSTKPVRIRKAEALLIEKGISANTVKAAIRMVYEEAVPLSRMYVPVTVRKKMIAAMFEDLVGELAHSPMG